MGSRLTPNLHGRNLLFKRGRDSINRTVIKTGCSLAPFERPADTRQPCPTSAPRPHSSSGHFHETAASAERRSNGSCPKIAPCVNQRYVSALVELVGTSRSEASAPTPQILEPMQNEFAPRRARLQRPPAGTLVKLEIGATRRACLLRQH